MDWPVSVALAQSVPELPTGTDWSYEVKLDGHRMIMWRTGDGVRLQARSGRDVTAAWGDLALAGLHLPAGTVLDGEAVITTEDGRISFEAAQARAASSPTRGRRLAAQRPAHYIAFDALQLPSGDARPRPYSERRAALLNLLAGLPTNTPVQAVSATTDRDTALTWYNTLHKHGVEGIVAKRTTSPYRAGRAGARLKIRHADTIEATVAGFTGTARQPRALAPISPAGRPSRIDQALYGVIMEAYVRGVSTYTVYDLVKALGTTAGSPRASSPGSAASSTSPCAPSGAGRWIARRLGVQAFALAC